MRVVKVTSKGQVTIPSEVRDALGIDESSYLEVAVDADTVRLRKVMAARPLGGDDPIWKLVGSGSSGHSDASENHDAHLAEGEAHRWRES